MIIRNETNDEEMTEQEVDYKVNGGTPPPLPDAVPDRARAGEGGPCDIFDDAWRQIPAGGQVGPCPPPAGQRPPWTVRFQVRSGDLVEEIPQPGYASAFSTVILKNAPDGGFEVEVITPGLPG